MSLRFVIRPGAHEDEGFVFATWLKNYKHSSRFAKRIPDSVFYEAHHPLITGLVARSHVLVACDPQSPVVIYGYTVAEPDRHHYVFADCLHYVFVKAPFRLLGVGRALLSALGPVPAEFSHWTYDWDGFGAKYRDMRYNPYRALCAQENHEPARQEGREEARR